MEGSMRKDVTINIDPCNAYVERKDGQFTLCFVGGIGGDYSRHKTVKIHMKRYWVKVIASLLWEVIDYEEEKIENAKQMLRMDHDN
jgi:hypothetical protein